MDAPQQQQQRPRESPARPSPPPRASPHRPGDLSMAVLSLALFFAVATLLFSSGMETSNGSFSMLHQVPEGHVGVYWRGGALLKTITDPGFHWKLPFITQFEPIQVTIQTDEVRDIPCGTKGGVMISFGKIEVVNRLRKEYVYETLLNYGVKYDKTWIYDKIHHEINQFCSLHTLQEVYIDMFDQIDEKMKEAIQSDCTRYAPGIEIIGVRVTKPIIPVNVKRNFEQMEEERTKPKEDKFTFNVNQAQVNLDGYLPVTRAHTEDGIGYIPLVLIAIEKQKVAEKEAETQKKMALTEAEKNAQVSRILMEQKLMEKNSAKREQEIDNEIYIAREKSLADASYYRVMKEAEANKLKLTPEYLELKFIEAIANNSKIFFGDRVPKMIFDQRLLGNFLNDIAKEEKLEA